MSTPSADIVARLREQHRLISGDSYYSDRDTEVLLSEAADEIAELRRANASLEFTLHKSQCVYCGGPNEWARKDACCDEGKAILRKYDEASKAAGA